MSYFSPFVGLRPYKEGDRAYFFGRDREKRLICSNLLTAPLTILYGPSGCGKSSILGAGVLPTLELEDAAVTVYFHDWQSLEFLNELKRECLKAAGLPKESDISGTLDAFLKSIVEKTGKMVLLIFDQFEEFLLYHESSPGETGFEAEFARTVNRPDIEVNVLIGIREDSISKLDRFKARIANLLSNTLRLERLDSEQARQAIRGPIEVYNRSFRQAQPAIVIEDSLVDELVRAVRTGQVRFGTSAGIGNAKTDLPTEQVETAFLQLVLERIWKTEIEADSALLRLDTLKNKLRGAQHIVESYLDDVMKALTDGERAICVQMFHYLVTPSRMKVAQTTRDLISFADSSTVDVVKVLQTLDDARILSRIDQPPQRYEIFHDVLAGAVLDWSTRYNAAQEARKEEKERKSRWVIAALALLSFIALATALVAVKFARDSDRSNRAAVAASTQEEAIQEKAADESKKFAMDRAQSAVQMATDARIAANNALLAKAEVEKAYAGLNKQTLLRLSVQDATYSQDALTSRDQNLAATMASYSMQESVEAAGTPTPVATQAVLQVAAWAKSPISFHTSGHSGAVRNIAFSPDGSLFASASFDDTAKVWDARSGREIATLAGHKGGVFAVAYSPNGHIIATGSLDNTVKVWDPSSGTNLATLTGPTNWVWGVQFAPDGKTIAASSKDGQVHFWSFPDGANLPVCCAVKDGIFGLAFSSDGKRLATAGSDNKARLWNIVSGELLNEFSINTPDTVDSVAFSPDGKRIVSAGEGDSASIWNISNPGDVVTLTTTRSPNKSPTAVSSLNSLVAATFNPTGTLVATGGSDNVSRIWDAASGDLRQTLAGQTGSVWAVAFDPKDANRIVTGGPDGSIKIWNVETGNLELNIQRLSGATGSVAFSETGLLVAAPSVPQTQQISVDGASSKVQVQEWEQSTGHLRAMLTGNSQPVNAVAISADGTVVASAGQDKQIHVWDFTGNDKPLGVTAPMEHICLSSDGRRLAASGADYSVHIWELFSGKMQVFTTPGVHVHDLTFNRDGTQVLIGGEDGIVETLNIRDGQVVTAFKGQSLTVNHVAFDAGNDLVLAAGANGSVVVWDSTRPLQPIKFSGHLKGVNDAVFSPNGKKVASISDDQTLQVWDSSSGQNPLTFKLISVGVRVFFNDRGQLVVYDRQANLREFPLILDQAVPEVRRLARTLKSEECQRYFGTAACPSLH